MLYWIDFVSLQFFPSMHPLTRFAIQAWGAEKMRCQNIIICPLPLLPPFHPTRILSTKVVWGKEYPAQMFIRWTNVNHGICLHSLMRKPILVPLFCSIKILKMLQSKELPVHINAEPHPTFDMLWLMWLVGRYGESIARKSFSANVNSCLKTGGVMWKCDVITLCEAEDGLTGPGPRWIGCRIKGSGILTTEPDPNPESHLQGTKGGNPSAADGEISNLGFNICL